jgi:hypothetical protein
MKTIRSFIIFILVFSVEIKVKASGLQNFSQKPKGCLEKHITGKPLNECFAGSLSMQTKLKIDDKEIIFSKDTVVKFGVGQLTLVSGLVAVKSSKPSQVQTLFGSVQSEKGEYWVEVSKDSVTATNVIGRLVVEVDNKKMDVIEKFEVSYWQTSASKQISHGVPKKVEVQPFLSQWSKLHFGSKEELLNNIEEFKTDYAGTVETESQLYQKIADRHLASLSERESHRKKAEQQKKDLEAQRKRLYFEKVFER